MTTKKQKLSDVAKTLQMTPNDLIALFSAFENTELFVHGNMVVGNHSPVFIREHRRVAHGMCRAPHLIYYL